MATLYPNQIDGTAQLPNVSGTFTLDGTVGGADHALVTTNINTAAIAIEQVLGTTAGTSVISAFVAGQTALPIQSGTLGTTIAKGTINNSVFGTPTLQAPTISGQGTNSGTIANGVYGTPQITGGTHNNGIFGTPSLIGGTVGSTSVLQPLQSAFFYQGSTTLTTGNIPFANKLLDVLSEYNGTQFVAAQAGIYEFYSQTALSGNSSDFNIEIHYNGTVVSTVRCNPNGWGIPVMWLGSVVAGGTVVSYSQGGTGAIGTQSYFWGKRVY